MPEKRVKKAAKTRVGEKDVEDAQRARNEDQSDTAEHGNRV